MPRRRILAAALIALAIFLTTGPEPSGESRRTASEVVSITDGDTINVKVDGSRRSVRLIGIDAPESRDNERARRMSRKSGRDLSAILENGRRSEAYLSSLVKKGARVELESDVESKDRYGRTLAYVFREDGSMLNELMLRDGYAYIYTVPPNVRYAGRFERAFEEARKKGKGLWASR